MSLRPTSCGEVPAATAAVARAAFPKGNRYLDLRDAFGSIFDDGQFGGLFAVCGRPAECPWRLALVTLLQFAEDLSDRCAADAVRGRIDWKYLLGLELTDHGFDASVLSEFRTRLVESGAEALLFDTLLERCRERGLLRKRGRQRTDSTHVLGAVRALNRLDCAIESLRAALNALAVAAPGWLRDHADPAWADRYARRADDIHVARGARPRDVLLPRGLDATGMRSSLPSWPPALPCGCARYRLSRCCDERGFRPSPSPKEARENRVQSAAWCTGGPRPRASRPRCSWSRHPDVHYAKKRATTAWIGYKVHLTETCDDERPPLITHVATTPAPLVDRAALASVHTALATKGLLPDRHLVDAGYLDADQLVSSARDHGVALVGPVPRNNQWQGRTDGAFTLEDSPSTGTDASPPARRVTRAEVGATSMIRSEQ